MDAASADTSIIHGRRMAELTTGKQRTSPYQRCPVVIATAT